MNIAAMKPVALGAMVIALAVAVPAPAQAASSSLDSSGEVSIAVLRGENETGPNDSDGVGVGLFKIDTATGEICFLVAHVKIDGTIAASHIHRAPAGVNGPVVVNFGPPVEHVTRGCVTTTTALATEIAGNPAGFYYNIHTNIYPAGAIRGQLM